MSGDRDALKVCSKGLPACPRSDMAQAAHPLLLAARDPGPGAPPAPAPGTAPPGSSYIYAGGQSFFLRADPLDNPFPGLTQSAPAGQALGASFGYTRNDFVQSTVKSGASQATVVSSSSSVTFTGMATYLLNYRKDLSNELAWVPAVWIYGNGNWDNPTKAFGDTSALKMGPKAEFLLYPLNGSHFSSYFDVAPFFQSDFYGQAQAGGVSVDWMPLNPELFLGGVPDGFNSNIMTGFLELVADATNLDVTKTGQTNLLVHDYQWLGGAARLYLFPFPSRSDTTSPIDNRIAFVGTIQSYWDANSRATATLYSAALQYKLACDTKATTWCPLGAPSVTLQYDNGTDKDMVQEKKLLKLTLSYAY